MPGQFPDLDVDVPVVSPAEIRARIDAGESITVLDTRRPDDFAAWQLTGPTVTAVNVPFYEFQDIDGGPVDELPAAVPDGPVVTCCAKGISSEFVAEVLALHGHPVEAMAEGMVGWARLYERRRLATGGDATVVQFHRPSSGCLAYLVASGDEAAVVDPLRAFPGEYAAAADAVGASVAYAIDTHVHADHVSGAHDLAASTGATHVVPAGAEDRGFVGSDYRTVADGDVLTVGDATVEAVHLPGHTSEMTGFRVGDVLLGGDTLFVDGVARPDLESGADGAADAARRLYDTVQDLAGLPDGTVVAPGHAGPDTDPAPDGSYAARLGDLRDALDVFAADRETFVADTLDGRPPRPNNYQTIIEANLGRRELTDRGAFELELGPNNCAAE